MADTRIEENIRREEALKARARELGAPESLISNVTRQTTFEEEPIKGLTDEEMSAEAPVRSEGNPDGIQEVTLAHEGFKWSSNLSDIRIAQATQSKPHSLAYTDDLSITLGRIKRALSDNIQPKESHDHSKQILNMSPDVEWTMSASQGEYARSMTDALAELIKRGETAGEEAEPFVAMAKSVEVSVIESQFIDLPGRQRIIADAFADESPSNRWVREQTSRAYSGDYYKKYYEDRGVLDTVFDGIGLVVDPISFTLDVGDFVDALNPEFKGGRFEGFKNIISGWRLLDPDLKIEMIPELVNALDKAFDGNQFKVGAMLGLMQDPEFAAEIDLSKTIDQVEVATLIPLLTLPYRAAKALKGILSLRKTMKGYRNPVEAVVGTKVGPTSQIREAMDADATNWENTPQGYEAVDGLAPVYQKMLETIKEEVIAPLSNIIDGSSYIKVNALSESEKQAAKTSYIDHFLKEQEGSIHQAEVIADSDTGFTVQYQVSTRGNKPVVQQRTVNWTEDDVGELQAVDVGLVATLKQVFGSSLLTPESLLREIDPNMVSNATFGGMQASVLRKQLADVWKKTDKGLNKTSRRKVDELMIAGDEDGVVFKAGDLAAGNVQTLSGKIKYSLDEVQAYYSKRAFMDEAHGMQDHITRSRLVFRGFKEVHWENPKTGIDEIQIAKPFKDGRGFTSDVNDLVIAPGLRGSTSVVTKRGNIDLKSAMEQGYRPVTFLEPVKIGELIVRHGLIPSGGKGRVSELPDKVLNYSIGYVARISKPGFKYIKDQLDGGKTVARAKTKQDAEKWIAARHAEQEAIGVEPDQRVSLIWKNDREISETDGIVEGANTYGGLYTGARSRTGIFDIGSLADEVTRLSTGQSVEKMVEAISSQMPMNEYRVAVTKRWRNTAKEALRKKENNIELDNPVYRQLANANDWLKADLSGIKDITTRKMLENSRTYMVDSLKVAHNEERVWTNFMTNVADLLPNNKVRNLVVNVAHTNPLQALKGATFDAYLGWFNIRQLYVQSQNAALAASMYPRHALGATKDAIIQRVFMFTPDVTQKEIAAAGKGMLTKPEALDVFESVQQYRRSGLRDSVMRTADYDANLGGFSQGSLESFRRIASKGRMFFEEGENMARLISWNIARRKWKEINPGKKVDDVAIRAIADDTLRMNMNMMRENASSWQTAPIIGNITQFFQVQAKLVENVVGGMLGNGRWTRKEASMAAAGQIILYGTVGVPLIESVAGAAKELFYENTLAFDADNPEAARAINRGAMGTMFGILGFENNFSEAGSIAAGLDDNIVIDLLTSIGQLAKGESKDISFSSPSAGVAVRGIDAMQDLFEYAKDLTVAPTFETLGKGAFKVIDSIASITSSWSNARKIVYLHSLGGIVDKRGNISLSTKNLEGESYQTLLAKAMGISMYREDAYYQQKLFNYDTRKAISDTKKALKLIYREFQLDGNRDLYISKRVLILAEYENQPINRQEIINQTVRSILEGKSGEDRERRKFLIDYTKSSGQTETKAFQSTYLGTGDTK